MATTQNIKTWQQLEAIVAANPGRVFVRWSRGPAADKRQGRSNDYLSGGCHAGLSAVKIDADWFGYPDEWYLIRRLKEYGFLRIKDSRIAPWIMVGDQVGTDSDGYESIEIAGDCYRLPLSLLGE